MAEGKPWEESPDEEYWQNALKDKPSVDASAKSEDAPAVPPPVSGWTRAEASYTQGETLELCVIGYNRGGLIVDLGDVRGFVPASQLSSFPRQPTEEERTQALAQYIDKKLMLKVIEFDRTRNRLILSERVVNPPVPRAEQLLAAIQPNEVRSGIVRNVTNFGAFIDLGGVEGLIHVSELSWQYVAHPKDVLTPGQSVDVFVIEVNREQKRIACSLKRLKPNPWEEIAAKVKPGDWISGAITSIVPFGAFVRVADGVEGLLHISELPSNDLLQSMQDGQTVEVRVMEIEPSQQRMRLSMRKPNERKNEASNGKGERPTSRRNIPPPPPTDDAYWESLIET
ncbi:MAG: S1 RNA-binding domain-containing protein [Chloroflexi bacterium]|nr:S1 RNA-binding domain-containing protein [Chloroflexota bacterium]